MSFFIERYATNLGVKPTMPYISDHFYPIEYNKYITIDASSISSVNNYNNWNFVITQLKQFLPDHKFIQVGLDKSLILDACDKKISNSCTLKNTFYVIRNSSLHIGIDCICSHISSYYGIPTVAVYSKYPSSHTKPIYADQNKFVSLDGKLEGKKYTFSDDESSDRINSIKPEKIISNCLDLLNIKHPYKKYKTINIGKLFPSNVIEIVPNFDVAEDKVFEKIVNLRFDYTKERKYAESWLQKKCNLLINSPIDVDLILKYKDNIKGATIFMDLDSFSEEYLNIFKQLNILTRLTCSDNKIISDVRLKFFDHTINEYKITDKKDLDFYKDICNNSFYYSNKMLMSKGKQYSSKAALENNIEYKEGDFQRVIDTDSFWEEVEHFNIYQYA